jgi:DNA-directed RNA polymerase subunit RPC12/RpoP
MQRTETIITKIRPIKKMFVIDLNDYDKFSHLFLKIQEDVDIMSNLLFVNDDYLWSDSAFDFVERSDPDIILNLSSLEDEKLSSHFRTFTVKPFTDQYKIERFCTQLISFQNKPQIFNTFNFDENEEIIVFSADKLDYTPESLFICVNYGLAEDKFLKAIELSIFKNLKIENICDLNTAVKNLFSKDKYINFLTPIIDFTSTGNGHSIYEIEYNKDNIFTDKNKYFFISEFNDFKSISYFWNIRSFYSYSNLAWLPDLFLSDITSIINKDDVFVCFANSVAKKITELYPTNKIFQPDRLYFHTKNTRWRFFEHIQTINIIDDKIEIYHPYEKSFGSMGAFIFEIYGLKEFALPKYKKIGELFSYRQLPGFDERFCRISSVGLAKYHLSFEPFHQFIREDLYDVVYLKKFDDIVKYIFHEANFDYSETSKTSILKQTFNIFGKIDDLSVLSDETMFNLISSLTPLIRSKKIMHKLGLSNIEQNKTEQKIASIRDEGGLELPNVIHTLDEFMSIAGIQKENSDKYYKLIQNIFDKNILLRGKYFDCPYCGSKVWIQLNSIKRKNRCPECNNKIDIPITGTDYYRLNHLIVRAVDQGQLATLLLLYFLFRQKYYLEFISNVDVKKDSKTVTDIDLFIKLGRRIGIIESKSKSGFEERQVADLLDVALSLKCDFAGFSTLLDCNDPKVKELFNFIKKKSCNIPVFIITSDILFNPKAKMINPFFEPASFGNKYPTGPLFVCKLPSDYAFRRNLDTIVQSINSDCHP